VQNQFFSVLGPISLTSKTHARQMDRQHDSVTGYHAPKRNAKTPSVFSCARTWCRVRSGGGKEGSGFSPTAHCRRWGSPAGRTAMQPCSAPGYPLRHQTCCHPPTSSFGGKEDTFLRKPSVSINATWPTIHAFGGPHGDNRDGKKKIPCTVVKLLRFAA